MAVIRGVKEWPQRGGELFDRAQAYTTTPGQNGWTIADTSAAGTPTYLNITEDGGAAKLTLASTSEVENVCLYQNDVLPLDLASLQRIDFTVQVAAVDSVTTIVFGVGTARNDTPDSVTVNAWFRMEGSASTTNLLVETDDNVTDNDDKATGQTLAAVYKTCSIDFSQGLADVRFFIDGERVASGTTFSMTGITAGQNVQPIVQIQKASGTGVPSITIARIVAKYRYAYGV
jgi:hypothetical protein